MNEKNNQQCLHTATKSSHHLINQILSMKDGEGRQEVSDYNKLFC